MIVRAVLPNPKGLLVRPVRARSPYRRYVAAGYSHPQKAVMQGKGGMYVYVVNKDNAVEIRPIKPGDWFGDSWIIDEGLEPGERVIVDGVNKVGVGSIVKVNETASKPL